VGGLSHAEVAYAAAEAYTNVAEPEVIYKGDLPEIEIFADVI
jgi:hypothetical protein